MNPDIFIVISSVAEFIFFTTSHIVIFRYIKKPQVLKWISYLFIFVGITAACGEWYLFSIFSILPEEQILLKLLSLWFIFWLYALYVFIYTVYIFGSVESAIRVRLLNMVAEGGNRGIKKTTILENYNKNIIIRKRLLRLTSSGELAVENNQYRINKSWSLIFFPVLVTKVMQQIYCLNKCLSKKFCDL